MNKTTILIFLLFLGTLSFSQIVSSTAFVQGNISDGEKLTKAYLTPLEHAMSFANSDGNINFTNSNKKISFYFGVNLAIIGTLKKDLTYDVNSLNLKEMEPSNPNQTIAQTYFGDESYIELQSKTTYKDPNPPFGYTEKPIYKFNTPQGNSGMLKLPSMNVGIYGYGTHLSINGLVKINIPNTTGTIYSLGASLQHNLNQFIKPIANWPIDISILVAYQKTTLDYYLDVKPDETRTELNLSGDNGPYDNQVLTINTKAIPLELIISKKIHNLHLYGFAGYSIQQSTVELKGNYPIYASDPNNTLKVNVEDISDPFSYQNSFNGTKFGAGAVYQLAFIKFKANTSYSKYILFNFGFELVF